MACPSGQVHAGGGCGVSLALQHRYSSCSRGEIWAGGSCLLETPILDDCDNLRMLMQRQAQRVAKMESTRQIACASGPSASCDTASASWESEHNLYQSLQGRYQNCRASSAGKRRFAGFTLSSISSGHGLNWPDFGKAK